MNLSEWAIRIYDEEDFGRSVSITSSGILGLLVYLWSRDWPVSLFVSIIAFPVLRLVSSEFHARWKEKQTRNIQSIDALKKFENFSSEEKQVFKAFVDAGAAVMTFTQVNRSDLTSNSIESLVHREILSTSMTSDGERETFVMDIEYFDAALRAFPRNDALEAK